MLGRGCAEYPALPTSRQTMTRTCAYRGTICSVFLAVLSAGMLRGGTNVASAYATVAHALAAGQAYVLMPLGTSGSNALLFVSGVEKHATQDVFWTWAVPQGFDAAPCLRESVCFRIGTSSTRDFDLAPFMAAAGVTGSVAPRQIKFHCQRSQISRYDSRFSCTMVVEARESSNLWRYTVSNSIPATASRSRPLLMLSPCHVTPLFDFKVNWNGYSDVLVGISCSGCTVNMGSPPLTVEVYDSLGTITNRTGSAADFPFG